MKALIVDDERPARSELRRLLSDFPWVEIIGEATNVAEAKAAIDGSSPALVFLDIQMPGGSGFDLLGQLEHVPQIIFTTAYHEHAIRAFEVNALDYLLKPIESSRLADALARVRKAGQTSDSPATASTPLQQLFVQQGEHCWFVPLREVRLLTSEGNSTRLSWGARKPLMNRSLVALEARLDPAQFFRANRRQVINLEFIEHIELGVSGRLHVQLRDDVEVEISRRQSRVFKALTGG